jgi:hypothetical protein
MIPKLHSRRFIAALLSAIVFAAALSQAQNNGSASPETGKSLGSSTQNQPGDQSAQDQAQSESMFAPLRNTRFWLSGQANFIFQTHPDFHAPYSGKNSLSPRYEKATSRVLTLYTGMRLNDSTEVLVDIE